MAAELPPRPSAADVEDAIKLGPAIHSAARTLAAEVLHLRARVAELKGSADNAVRLWDNMDHFGITEVSDAMDQLRATLDGVR